MFKTSLKKPDGRAIHLYSLRPIPDGIEATNPTHSNAPARPHFRWHPLRNEWVIYASHRQNRTFLPPPDYSPLLESTSKEFPTEMPKGDYEVAVFENLFPSLNLTTTEAPTVSTPSAPATGVCEVVVFTKKPDASLGQLPVDRIDLILEVMGERTRLLGENEKIQYVMPFENRGVEMGVTLHHPHGQIYAYPFVPPLPALMQGSMKKHHAEKGTGLLADMIAEERRDGRRIIAENDGAIAFIPVCARYPYETWLMPKRPVAYLHELSDGERADLARLLKTLLQKFDLLWKKPFPYLMLLFQAPTDGAAHPESHAHFQFYPPYRTSDRLKFLAGTELGAGIFVNDSLPEEKAAELRAVITERTPSPGENVNANL